ncbi:protein BONZAI 1 isoform X2 [Selaginella moellendorffii]|uniref:protein BONZAI 1 isoform X2 n=1 Tax=Selaginella moellendorffii TaxID=88036 RepID=UPI000D1C6E6D|nr:protein BONZAI 1 isoform X2 [Selaginella moellendorffii]|eukprot:XP_024519933.1 protein BONZAI 1 isoform X2 [Selaginella moellendorffii]
MGSCCSDMSGGMDAVGGMDVLNLDKDTETAVPSDFLSGTRGVPADVQLWISASKLRDKDFLSKSDPLAVAFIRKDGVLEEVGRTEVVSNTLNPSWVTDIKVSYSFQDIQQLLFRVYDIDTKYAGVNPQELPLEEQDFLGEMTCLLAEVVAAPGQSFSRLLQDKVDGGTDKTGVKSMGTLTIKAEEMQHSKSIVELVLRCSDLNNKDFFSKSDPFLRLSRLREDGSSVPVYKSEVKKNNLHPTWKLVRTTLQQLNNGNMDRPLVVECFNYNGNGRHDLIGSTQVSLNELQASAGGTVSFELKRPSDNQAGGKLHVEGCRISSGHSFLDYLRGGCQLSFMVAVDFTASNGNPHQQDSLHYLDPSGKPNSYEIAIESVGEVLYHYDYDKLFAAWGFGGKPMNSPVSHCFNLNGHSAEVGVVVRADKRAHILTQVDGVDGILRAYSQALKSVALAGPTLFAPVVNMASSIASEYISQEKQKYFVLLIITDGVITDLHQTINAIVNAASLPLSILIVGVGGADFTEMEVLDADKRKLQSSDGRLAERDIVQFVPLRDMGNKTNLRRTMLAELPTQLLEFMRSRSIVPNLNLR